MRGDHARGKRWRGPNRWRSEPVERLLRTGFFEHVPVAGAVYLQFAAQGLQSCLMKLALVSIVAIFGVIAFVAAFAGNAVLAVFVLLACIACPIFLLLLASTGDTNRSYA